MRWDIDDKLGRVDLWFFTGINFGGMKKVVRLHPYGGLQGADVDGAEIKSMGVIAEPGVRVILRTAATNTGWEALPWRCIQVLKGFTGKLSDGRTCVQIPDLDLLNAPTARRSDPEVEEAFPHAESMEDGEGWTFGRTGKKGLKCNIRSIRIERIPGFAPPEDDAPEFFPVPDEAPAPAAAAPEAPSPEAVASAPTAESTPAAPAAAAAQPAAAAPAAAAPANPPADAPKGKHELKGKAKEPEATIPVSDGGPGSAMK